MKLKGYSLPQKAYITRVMKALAGEDGPVHFIDPGVTGTGYATWVEIGGQRATRPIDCGCVKGIKKNENWQDRAYYVVGALTKVFDEYGTRVVVVEWPELWTGSSRSQTAAERGDIIKLAHLCGEIDYCCRESGFKCVLVRPSEWKGQLGKQAVINRIKRRLNNWSPTSHDADAVAMGLVAMGVF